MLSLKRCFLSNSGRKTCHRGSSVLRQDRQVHGKRETALILATGIEIHTQGEQCWFSCASLWYSLYCCVQLRLNYDLSRSCLICIRFASLPSHREPVTSLEQCWGVSGGITEAAGTAWGYPQLCLPAGECWSIFPLQGQPHSLSPQHTAPRGAWVALAFWRF